MMRPALKNCLFGVTRPTILVMGRSVDMIFFHDTDLKLYLKKKETVDLKQLRRWVLDKETANKYLIRLFGGGG